MFEASVSDCDIDLCSPQTGFHKILEAQKEANVVVVQSLWVCVVQQAAVFGQCNHLLVTAFFFL